MSAYVILVRSELTDPEEFARYSAMAKSARNGHPSTPLAYYGTQEVLEGAKSDGVVIIEFPDIEAAKAWYNDPVYQAAVVHRKKAADCQVIVVQGI